MTVARSMSPRRGAKVVVEEVVPKAGGEEGGAGAVASHSRSEHREDHHEGYEFGGPWGALGIMVFSHVVVYVLWAVNERGRAGSVLGEGAGARGSVPTTWAWWSVLPALVWERALPTWGSVGVYGGFLVLETLLALAVPGVVVYGLPLPWAGGSRLPYVINGFACWVLMLALVTLLETGGLFSLEWVAANVGPLLTTAVLSADALSLAIYLGGLQGVQAPRGGFRMSGNHVYDFFMGSVLNPRLLWVDVKMWAEVRVSWHLLFLLTLSNAVAEYKRDGALSPGMWVVVLAHLLYTNACAKGEECIPTTWDMYSEKFGFMLCFWNLAGVPFSYVFQSRFILNQDPAQRISWAFAAPVLALLLVAYVVWDQANGQKNRLRMRERGQVLFQPFAFPQLPWTDLGDSPRMLRFESGRSLLVDGWYRHARKIHYAADVVMALCWGLACGLGYALPFWYAFFFTAMITHREGRDSDRCKAKYGKDWDTYTATVPYRYVPGIW